MESLKSSKSALTKRIVIVEPVSSGIMLVEEAKSMGLEVIVASLDQNERCLPEVVREQVDNLIVVDTDDENALGEALVNLAQHSKIDAVIPGFEYYVPIVSRINAKLGLPGLPPESVDAVRNKLLMRQSLHAHGVRVPAFVIAEEFDELKKAALLYIGFPAVLKPVDACGSIHVRRVNSMAELQNAYTALTAETRTDLDRGLSKQVLLEAYIEGSEFSVEGFVAEGKPHIISITEKILGSEPYFVELGHIVGTDLPLSAIASIQNYVTEVVAALGVTLGPFHCEIRLKCNEPTLIELAARLPGDCICELVALAHNISLPRIMIEAYLGYTPSILQTVSKAKCFAGIRFFSASGLTHYTNVTGIKEIALEPGFVKSGFTIHPGESIPPLIDFRGRIGFAIFTAPTYQEIRNKFMKVDNSITFKADF